LVNWYYGVLGD
jgi:hypothetical protein